MLVPFDAFQSTFAVLSPSPAQQRLQRVQQHPVVREQQVLPAAALQQLQHVRLDRLDLLQGLGAGFSFNQLSASRTP
jgi:hypothetical protein